MPLLPQQRILKDQSKALESKKSLNKSNAQTAKREREKLEKELKALQREALRKKKAIAAKKNDERKYKQEAAILKNEEKCLEGRKINKEPLNGIYEDLVGPYQLARKIEEVFNMRKPNSPIYVGTAAGPGKAHAVTRKREHDKKWGKRGGIMRLIQVTEHADAADAEKAGIKALNDVAEINKKTRDVQNQSAGGEGIRANAPYHFVYIYYVPKKDPSA